jgi:hypothetical protein
VSQISDVLMPPSIKNRQASVFNLVEFRQRAISPNTNPHVPKTAPSHDARICPPPFPARKRGKRVSRRNGQDPTVRVSKRADGTKYYFFQFWTDVPGREERKRMTQVIGLTSEMSKSEAERNKLEFISNLKLNSNDYRIPSSATFADAVRNYGEFSLQECSEHPHFRLRMGT